MMGGVRKVRLLTRVWLLLSIMPGGGRSGGRGMSPLNRHRGASEWSETGRS
jgi:hypothetical protein